MRCEVRLLNKQSANIMQSTNEDNEISQFGIQQQVEVKLRDTGHATNRQWDPQTPMQMQIKQTKHDCKPNTGSKFAPRTVLFNTPVKCLHSGYAVPGLNMKVSHNPKHFSGRMISKLFVTPGKALSLPSYSHANTNHAWNINICC